MDASEIGEPDEAEAVQTRGRVTDELLSQLAAANEQIAALTADLARVEQRVDRGRDRYRTLLANLPAVTYIVPSSDLDAAQWVSPQTKQVLGYSPEDFKASPHIWRDSLHPDDRDGVLEAMAHAWETGEPLAIEYRFITPDGHTIWIRDHAALVCDEEGAPRFWQGVILDGNSSAGR